MLYKEDKAERSNEYTNIIKYLHLNNLKRFCGTYKTRLPKMSQSPIAQRMHPMPSAAVKVYFLSFTYTPKNA